MFSSIVTKISLAFISIIVILLLLMNTYFLTASRNMMFSSKQTSLENQSSVISSSLSALDSLTKDSVGQVFELLEVGDFARVVVVDTSGNELYSSKSGDLAITDFQITDFLGRALCGSDIFYSKFSDRAFSSGIFIPVIIRGVTVGAFCVNELDLNQGEILIGLQHKIRSISVVIVLFSIIVTAIVVYTMRQRINTIMDAIDIVREGEYAYRIHVTGNDELTRLSSEFNDLTSRLQETDERRRRFVADASHELKTPLASIRLLSDSILQNDTMSGDTVREFITDIGDEASRLARTTEKLISLTRLDNKVASDRGRTDMSIVTATTIRLLNPLAEERGITILSELEDGCYVLSSDDELRHITLNLIENAIKYNHDCGSVFVALKKTDAEVTLTVDDTGIGIPEEDIPHIFDRFYRVDKARSRAAGGSGLGLAIVRNTVKELGGKISVTRRDEGGMRFLAVFPLYGSN